LTVRAQAIQALCEQSRAGGFSDAANAREQKRVSDTTLGDRVRERLRDMLLTDQILK
jgi:hypothetical protein